MKSNTGYYLFCHENNYYLYDLVGSVILQLNPSLYNALKKYANNEECTLQEQEFINMFLSSGLLQDFSSIPDPAPIESKVAYLSFAPTYKCNFRCSYCFGDHGEKYKGEKREFTKESLIQTLDYFFLKAFPNAKQYRIDFVSSGEPLLGLDIIKEAVKYIEKYSVDSGKQISMWLCTNGSLLTDEIIEYLSLHNISIGISLDGRKKYNDATRFDVNGNGTYDKICSGISLIQNNKKVSKKFKYIWGLCTATNENCDFIDILNHMNELGFKNVQIRLIRSSEKYDVEKINTQYDRLSNALLSMYSQGNLTYFRMILNDNDQFGKVLKRMLLDHLLIRRCNAGTNKITICPDGTIYPCDSLVGFSDFALGTINDGWNRTLYKETTVNSISKCQECNIKYLCGGDCYYNSFMKTGCRFTPDNEFCQIQRHIINLAIVLRYQMQITNPDLYESFLREVKKKNDYSELFG